MNQLKPEEHLNHSVYSDMSSEEGQMIGIIMGCEGAIEKKAEDFFDNIGDIKNGILGDFGILDTVTDFADRKPKIVKPELESGKLLGHFFSAPGI